MAALVLNIILFQIGWWACVLGAANQLPWLGPVVMLVPVGWWLATGGHAGRLVAIALIGFAVDCLLAAAGFVVFPNQPLLLGLCPLWMLALWFGFATLLDRSLAWMRGSIVLPLLFGVLGAPLAYIGAVALQALQVEAGVMPWVAIAAGWGGVLVLIYRVFLPGPAPEPAATAEVQHV